MPEPYEILNARVKQKVATEADWLSVEDDLGVIFEGEQTFVIDDAGTPVNFKIGDGTKKFSELPYWIVYSSAVVTNKRLTYLNANTNITVNNTFRDQSNIYDVIILNNSGTEIPLNIGTTDGGMEICSVTVPNGPSILGIKYYFTSAQTVYFTGLNGKNFSMFVIYYQYDESPAVPVSTSSNSLFAKGFAGIFEPLYIGHSNDVWDFDTGLGKPNSGYQNCCLSGTNGTKFRGGKYSVGYKTGDTIGNNVGNANNNATLITNNLPAHSHSYRPGGKMSGSLSDLIPNGGVQLKKDNDIDLYLSSTIQTGNTGAGIPFSIQPDSIIDLWFVAIS